MKKILSLLVGGMLVVSCNTNPCKDIACGAFGDCDEGLCICEAGYEQDADGLCSTEERAKFLGTWAVSDVCSNSGNSSYTVVVSKNASGITEISITNFWGTFQAAVKGTVTGNTFTIPRQEPDNDGFFVESTGTVTINELETRINMTFTVTEEPIGGGTVIATDNCTSTWTK